MGHSGKPIPNAGSGGDAVVNRIAVGAHYGLKDWLVQRVSAIVMAVYSVGFAVCVLPRMPYGFDSWRALFAPAWSKIAALLFIAALLVHAWIGVRDIFMDYIKPMGIRLTLQIGVILALLVYGLWAITILWSF
jgi:succinate dehydrogenase / fumarate reductase, membrane anchor subunit